MITTRLYVSLYTELLESQTDSVGVRKILKNHKRTFKYLVSSLVASYYKMFSRSDDRHFVNMGRNGISSLTPFMYSVIDALLQHLFILRWRR